MSTKKAMESKEVVLQNESKLLSDLILLQYGKEISSWKHKIPLRENSIK